MDDDFEEITKQNFDRISQAVGKVSKRNYFLERYWKCTEETLCVDFEMSKDVNVTAMLICLHANEALDIWNRRILVRPAVIRGYWQL